jgi:hypothetical protein
MPISPDRCWRNLSQHNEPVRPAGIRLAARPLVLAGLGCGAAGCPAEGVGLPADAATAQDLVNLLLVGPMLLILGWWGTAGNYPPISYGWSAWASP